MYSTVLYCTVLYCTVLQLFREALVKYLEVGLGGVRGVVRDQYGGEAREATVVVEGVDKNMTSSNRGEYWRLLAPGIYRYRYIVHCTPYTVHFFTLFFFTTIHL